MVELDSTVVKKKDLEDGQVTGVRPHLRQAVTLIALVLGLAEKAHRQPAKACLACCGSCYWEYVPGLGMCACYDPCCGHVCAWRYC